MIIDAHCHAWRRWPYDRAVPDPGTRASVEALLYEMGCHGVDHATVVCARIGGGAGGDGDANPDKNDYVTAAARQHPARITAWIDVDSSWNPQYHQPGAAARLRTELNRTGSRGFTHYLAPANDGWLRSSEAEKFFAAAEELETIASLSIGPAWFADLDLIAQHHPGLPILVHHLGLPGRGPARGEEHLARLTDLARRNNVGIKVSGFNYNLTLVWDFPYPEAQRILARLHHSFGPEWLYWGSDFPASRDMITYAQSIEALRSRSGLSEEDLTLVLGQNMSHLLNR